MFEAILIVLLVIGGVVCLVIRLRTKAVARAQRVEAVEAANAEAANPSKDPYSYRTDPRSKVLTDTARKNDVLALGLTWGSVACFALAVILLLLSTLVIVGTKEVGIELTFAKPSGTLTNGLHVKAPWQDVTEMDAAIQTDKHSTTDADPCKGGIPARIAHQTVGCADVSIRWRIVESAAGSLYQNYRDFDNVRDSLVTRELTVAVNEAMSGYDPLAVDEKGNSATISLDSVEAAVLTKMQASTSGEIEVLSILIPVVHYPKATQDRINALQAQVAQTRIAEQAEQTAAAQAAANKALAASVSTDPNVLVSKCYDLLSEMVAKGQGIPPGFSCWPGSGGVGVVVGGKS